MANRPKGKLFALLAIFVAIGLVTASGAFTSVTAQRTVSVDLAGDSAGLVQLQSMSQYATFENENLVITFDSTTIGGDATGLNTNATTQVDELFNVTNNGDQTVNFDFWVSGTNADALTFYNSSSGFGTTANVTGIGPQGTIAVGLQIDSDSLGTADDFEATLHIRAEAQ